MDLNLEPGTAWVFLRSSIPTCFFRPQASKRFQQPSVGLTVLCLGLFIKSGTENEDTIGHEFDR